jgi:hypothetical protein
MNRMKRATSLPLLAAAATAVLSLGIGTAAHASADTTSLTPPSVVGVTATDPIDNTQMRYTMQYLQLQSQMQYENRQYSAVSNILKTKHDTVKNSINNVH